MEKEEKKRILNETFGTFPQVMMWRRTLHQYPELAFVEQRTSRFVMDTLSREGIACRSIAGTGVLAQIEGTLSLPGREHDAVVLRADMDALPVTEATGLEFASAHKGVMHACGHDMHTAMLLGALRVLQRHRDQFCGTVFGLFQPGEELNPGGASLVMREDPFAGYRVVAFAGQHVEPMLKTGTYGFREGKYMASSDELRFRIRGVGGHAALRERIKDPVGAAAELIRLLYAIPDRRPDPTLPTIISIGRVEANGATNVVPDDAYMEGTMRTFDETWRARIKELIREAAAEVDHRFGTKTEVDISDGYPCVVNDPALTRTIAASSEALFGAEAVVALGMRPTSDDFGFYSLRYPSVYYRLGVGGDGDFFESHAAGRVHTATFRPDEKALGYGVVQFINIVFTLLSE